MISFSAALSAPSRAFHVSISTPKSFLLGFGDHFWRKLRRIGVFFTLKLPSIQTCDDANSTGVTPLEFLVCVADSSAMRVNLSNIEQTV